MEKYHNHKRFDVYCDYCGEPTRIYDEIDEWKEFEKDTLSLKICSKCKYKQFKNSKEYVVMKRAIKEKFSKIKETKESEKDLSESVDKRKGVWYNIINNIRRWFE